MSGPQVTALVLVFYPEEETVRQRTMTVPRGREAFAEFLRELASFGCEGIVLRRLAPAGRRRDGR